MVTPTKTLHPLPFEHLEPRRFEDLIRQLAYEFRNWRTLEATGRSGADEGYDIRGWEIVPGLDLPEPDIENDDEEAPTIISPENDREWLFQCKREKSIGPSRLEKYLDGIGQDTLGSVYGLIFAVSCDLSKKSRDVYRRKCRESGISECYVWSRGELEDMLFQPKNDGLLFAYFGISLKFKRRSLKTAIRTRLATKRKAIRALGDSNYFQQEVLLRDPEDEKYPYLWDSLNRDDHRWQVREAVGHHPLGIEFECRRHKAYLAEDGIHWDMADVFNDAVHSFDDPWQNDEQYRSLSSSIHEYYINNIDKKCQGILILKGLLRFEDIIEIDTIGDRCFAGPHIYVAFSDRQPPFSEFRCRIAVSGIFEQGEGTLPTQKEGPREVVIQDEVENRIEVFPKEFRRIR